jgi:hypothetical protein
MKTVGNKLSPFAITGVRPGQPEDAFFDIDETSFAGKWKVIVFYPRTSHLYAPLRLLRMTSWLAILLTVMLCCSQVQPTTSSAKWPGKRLILT